MITERVNIPLDLLSLSLQTIIRQRRQTDFSILYYFILYSISFVTLIWDINLQAKQNTFQDIYHNVLIRKWISNRQPVPLLFVVIRSDFDHVDRNFYCTCYARNDGLWRLKKLCRKLASLKTVKPTCNSIFSKAQRLTTDATITEKRIKLFVPAELASHQRIRRMKKRQAVVNMDLTFLCI